MRNAPYLTRVSAWIKRPYGPGRRARMPWEGLPFASVAQPQLVEYFMSSFRISPAKIFLFHPKPPTAVVKMIHETLIYPHRLP